MPGTKTLCTICNLTLNSHEQYVAHTAGRSHKRKESSGSAAEQQLTAPVAKIVRPNPFIKFVAGHNGNSPTSSQNIQNQSGTSEESQIDESAQNGTNVSLTQQNEVFCHTCMVRLTSQAQADMHFSGFKHKRALALTVPGASGNTRGEAVKRKIEEICEVCKVPLITKVVAEAHYAGAKHGKKLKLSQNVNPVNSCLPYSSLSSIGTVASHTAKAQAGNLFFCNYCKVSVNSQMQLDAHQQGTKHKNAVNGMIQQRKKTFKPRQPQEQSRFVNPPVNMTYVKPQEPNRLPEQSRYVGPNHFQTGNPNGPMQYRHVAYQTPYY